MTGLLILILIVGGAMGAALVNLRRSWEANNLRVSNGRLRRLTAPAFRNAVHK